MELVSGEDNFNQIWRKASLGEGDSSLFKCNKVNNEFLFLSINTMIIMCILN